MAEPFWSKRFKKESQDFSKVGTHENLKQMSHKTKKIEKSHRYQKPDRFLIPIKKSSTDDFKNHCELVTDQYKQFNVNENSRINDNIGSTLQYEKIQNPYFNNVDPTQRSEVNFHHSHPFGDFQNPRIPNFDEGYFFLR